MLLAKPEINFFAGWYFLFNHAYREDILAELKQAPGWIVLLHLIAGVCSVLFPIVLLGMVLFVMITK